MLLVLKPKIGPGQIFDPDTTGFDIYYTTTDTFFAYTDGLDSIFNLTTDTIIGDSIGLRTIATGLNKQKFDFGAARMLHPSEIGIQPGNVTKTINQGLYGINVAASFMPDAIPDYNLNSTGPLQWIVDLCPKSIRFPSGGSTKFMHLRPYRDVDGDPGPDPIKGYGYDIYEIIRYYDVTDGVIDADDPGVLDAILLDLATDGPADLNILDGDCDECITWMDAEGFRGDFEGYYSKWQKEQALSIDDNTAIEQFVNLISDIKLQWPKNTVDVIVCLNIFSESATQCKEIIKYLKYESNNNVIDVNVVGVEIGNENYFKSSKQMLGMSYFSNYWSYVKGGASDATWWTSFSDYVFSPAMLSDHNYINAFKLDPLVACKIGIPAKNIDEPGYALREAEEGPIAPIGLGWNERLRTKYNEKITGTDIYCFDAVILHPYYSAKDNYEDIALLFDANYPGPVFDFSSFDTRMELPFKGIIGTSATNYFGNYRDFIKTRYIESYNYQNGVLNFNLTGSNKKELWTTEWNLLDNYNNVEEETNILERVQIYHNTFASGMVMQEWFLKNLKLNYTPGYRENFFTYANFHNYHGTSNVNNLILDADCADFVNYGLDPDVFNGERYYLRRTNYYVFDLLGEIVKNNLKYIKANFFIGVLNPNNAPTVFISPDNAFLYVFYSNVKDTELNFMVNSDNMLSLFPIDPLYGSPIGIGLGNATIYCVDALMPYSGSGDNTMFTLNTAYTCGVTGAEIHPFEIRAENLSAVREFENAPECISEPEPGETCITVPGYSVGYFKIPIAVLYPPEKSAADHKQINILNLLPNPTSNWAQIVLSNETQNENVQLKINMYNATGGLVLSTSINNYAYINLEQLPRGIYLCSVTTTNGETFTKQVIIQ